MGRLCSRLIIRSLYLYLIIVYIEAQPRTLQSTLLIQKKKEMAEVQVRPQLLLCCNLTLRLNWRGKERNSF